MFNNKITTVFTSVAVTAAMLVATAGTVFAKSEDSTISPVESTTSAQLQAGQVGILQSGREGIDIPNSGYSGELDLARQKPASAQHIHMLSGVRFVQPFLQFTVENTGESQDTYTQGLNYIYFDLTQEQLAQWNSGTLAIYYYNMSTQSWQKLNTMMINRGVDSRLAARAVGFGTYGLGMTITTNSSTSSSQ